MKRPTLFSLAVLLASAALAAQTAGRQPSQGFGVASMEGLSNDQHQTQTIVISPQQQGSVCPVSVRAQQAANWSRREVDNKPPKGPAQRLHLTLVNPDSTRITGATVTVRGLTPRNRVTQTQLSTGDSSDAAKTLSITFTAGLGKDVASDLLVPGLSAVYSIDLDSIAYADGSTWKLAAGKVCRTPIDGFMLISGR
jgi:hypothetical protein